MRGFLRNVWVPSDHRERGIRNLSKNRRHRLNEIDDPFTGMKPADINDHPLSVKPTFLLREGILGG